MEKIPFTIGTKDIIPSNKSNKNMQDLYASEKSTEGHK